MNEISQIHNCMLDEKAAAVELGVSVKTLQGWRYRGGGPLYRKHGRAVRYSLNDLRSWSDSKRRLHTADPGPEA